jgi:hypothetical protein
MSALNIVADAKFQTNRTVNQPISAVPCVQNHTEKYTSKTTTTKIISKCGSPQGHTRGTQTASVSMPMTSS